MTIQQGTKALLKELSAIYDEREALAITDWVFEYLTGWRKLDRVINKDSTLPKSKIDQLSKITSQLIAHKPVQYVLQQAWFDGMKLYVDENVLIPRPETEELVEWALRGSDEMVAVTQSAIKVLDVGTGSGCIPIAIKKKRPGWEVYACDISEGALKVARKNATTQKVEIEFRQINFLDEAGRSSLGNFDLVISNPPYIALNEKSTIDKHVIEYEPHLALFVPTDDSLIFYKNIAEFGRSHLQNGGIMMMEMHYAQANAINHLFKEKGYKSIVRKDMHGNDRMIKVWK